MLLIEEKYSFGKIVQQFVNHKGCMSTFVKNLNNNI